MALLPVPLNFPTCSCASSSFSRVLLVQSQHHSSKTCKFRIFRCHSTNRAALVPARQRVQSRSIFIELVRQKWPLKPDLEIRRFPRRRELEKLESEEEGEPEISSSGEESVIELEPIGSGSSGEAISSVLVRGSKPRKPQLGSENDFTVETEDSVQMVEDVKMESSGGSWSSADFPMVEGVKIESLNGNWSSADFPMVEDVKIESLNGNWSSADLPMVEVVKIESLNGNWSSADFPWKREGGMVVSTVDGDRKRWRNIELAEKTLPELELRRLRSIALRMLERTRVGVAGITQALVDSIHQKWTVEEVVKLTFDEPFSLNMKRIHEIVESKTGGLVVWRSGSSIVLYRGIEYKHPLGSISRRLTDVVHGETGNIRAKDSFGAKDSYNPDSELYLNDLAKQEIMDLAEFNHLLDGLGPRFRDWSGRDPLPVDADKLPSVIPGYNPPLRVHPQGRMRRLKHNQINEYCRLARTMPPHFALGRNRELQGLAEAMVKLWQKNAVAKIALKRGVQNTSSERMAEELKKLTGGILLIRNKDFMLFYRGNDFLPPAVTDALQERHRLTELRQDEEELARKMASASIASKAKTSKSPLVAGTLAETLAATSRWGSQPSSEELENMMKESVLTKRAASVKYLEKKLADAKAKAQKADKALAKVQKHLEPAELPNDSEMLTDEERFLLHKMGLSMKPFLLLGRRGLYDGTIENMHLHWKHRELVKIIVRRKRFTQVMHIAISLEAESGGVLVSIDKTVEGHSIIVYRGKNYLRPPEIRPKNLLTKRQAFARSIELQRREALKHHISGLQEKIDLLNSELEDMRSGKLDVNKSVYSTMDDPDSSDVDIRVENKEGRIRKQDAAVRRKAKVRRRLSVGDY